LDYEAEIESIFERARAATLEDEFARLMTELESDAESIRTQGVQATAARAELERRLEQHSGEIKRLEKALAIIRSDEASTEQLSDARRELSELLARQDVSDLVRAFLNGVLLELIRQQRYDNVLTWVERLDDWSPADGRGVFAPLAIAARHLRGDKADRRLLDQQPPEVRKAVEMIIREAESSRSASRGEAS